MGHFLVVGYHLPAYHKDVPIEAANVRTAQIVQGLLLDGHHVLVLVAALGWQLTRPIAECPTNDPNLTYRVIDFSSIFWPRAARQVLASFNPDGMVSAHSPASALRALHLAGNLPLWVDLYGDPLCEQQGSAARRGSDRGIVTVRDFLALILSRADVFSTCSLPQRLVLVGELASIGRLTAATHGYRFCHEIPPAQRQVLSQNHCSPNIVNGLGLVEDDRVNILWNGSYNTWTDIETLFACVKYAMQRDARIHYLSVAGGGSASPTYERFKRCVENSEYVERFKFVEHVPSGELPAYFAQAHIGLNVDAFSYETETGTRTRIVDMMQHGLAIVTTLGCDITRVVHQADAGLAVPIGDAAALGEALLQLSTDVALRRKMALNGQRLADKRFSLAATTAPLRDWAASPYHAPDWNTCRVKKNGERLVFQLMSYLSLSRWHLLRLLKKGV